MRRLGPRSGLWELFLPAVKPGRTGTSTRSSTPTGSLAAQGRPVRLRHRGSPPGHGQRRVPVGVRLERRPPGIRAREESDTLHRPSPSTKCHLGSWAGRSPEGETTGPLTYPGAGPSKLPAYLVEHGFTHVEFLPVAEHPLRRVRGATRCRPYYAPDGPVRLPGRLSGPLVDAPPLRPASAVLVDWVPGPLPEGRTSPLAQVRRDGPLRGMPTPPPGASTPDWGTLVFNFGPQRGPQLPPGPTPCSGWRSTTSTACGSTAVASMLYLDYSRQGKASGSPTSFGGPGEPGGGSSFLKGVSTSRWLRQGTPGVITVAEGSRHKRGPMVSRPDLRRRARVSPSSGTWAGCTNTLDYFHHEPRPPARFPPPRS